MKLRSLHQHNDELAWQRVLAWSRNALDIPDRLPFEIHDRLGEKPDITRSYFPSQAHVVMASKKSGTFRPFVRLTPKDSLVYQCLGDTIALSTEKIIGHKSRIAAYRVTDWDAPDPFTENSYVDFTERLKKAISQVSFVIRCDITNYYLSIDCDRLIRMLLPKVDLEICDDLEMLFNSFKLSGVHGLPQGLWTSNLLANYYLHDLDQLFENSGARCFRWVDDIWVLVNSFQDARRMLDQAEYHLYEQGLSFAGEKTQIIRADTALEEITSTHEQIESDAKVLLEEAHYNRYQLYSNDDPADEDELEEYEDHFVTAAKDRLKELSWTLLASDTRLPPGASKEIKTILIILRTEKDPAALDVIEGVIRRMPDLIKTVINYLASIYRQKSSQERVDSLFCMLLNPENRIRDFERLWVIQGCLQLPRRSNRIASKLNELASSDQSDLIHARAVLAWGFHSDSMDTRLAEELWSTKDREWKEYAVLALQKKDTKVRNDLFSKWSLESPEIARLTKLLKKNNIRWAKL